VEGLLDEPVVSSVDYARVETVVTLDSVLVRSKIRRKVWHLHDTK
jgi:hypothetical protein